MALGRACLLALVLAAWLALASAQTPTPSPTPTPAANSTGNATATPTPTPSVNATRPTPSPLPLPADLCAELAPALCTNVGRVRVSPNNATINGGTTLRLVFEVPTQVQRLCQVAVGNVGRVIDAGKVFKPNSTEFPFLTQEVGQYGFGYANFTLELAGSGLRVCVRQQFRFNAPPEVQLSLAPNAARGVAVLPAVRTQYIQRLDNAIGRYYETNMTATAYLPIPEDPAKGGARPLYLSAAGSYDPDGLVPGTDALTFKWELEGGSTVPLRFEDADKPIAWIEPLGTAAWYWLRLTVMDADNFAVVVRFNVTVAYNPVVSMRLGLAVIENATAIVAAANRPGATRDALTLALARPFRLVPLQIVNLRLATARRALSQAARPNLAASFQVAPLFGSTAGQALADQLSNATATDIALSLATLDLGIVLVPPVLPPSLLPRPGNQFPVVSFAGGPAQSVLDTAGSFVVDASPSYDPDGYIAKWVWKGYAVDETRTYRPVEGGYASALARRPLDYVSDLALYPIANSTRVVIRDTTLYSAFFLTLTITDNDGFESTSDAMFTVSRVNVKPVIAADPDPPCQNFPILAPIVLRGGALNPNKDGSNLGLHPALEWRLSLGAADAFRFNSSTPLRPDQLPANATLERPPIPVLLPDGSPVALPAPTDLLRTAASNASLASTKGTGSQRYITILDVTRDGNYTVQLTATDWHGASVNVTRAICILPNWRRRVALIAADRLNVAVAVTLASSIGLAFAAWAAQAYFPTYASIGWAPSYTLGLLFHIQFLSLSGSLSHAPRDYRPIPAALAWTNLQFAAPWGSTSGEGGFPTLEDRTGDGTFAGGLSTPAALARFSAANVFVGTFFYAVVIIAGVFFFHIALVFSLLLWRRDFGLLQRIALPSAETYALLAVFNALLLSSANAARDPSPTAAPCAVAALVVAFAIVLPSLWAAVHRLTSRKANFLWFEPPWGFDAWRRAAVSLGLAEPSDDVDDEVAVRGDEPVLAGDPRRGLALAATATRQASPSPPLHPAGLSPLKSERKKKKRGGLLGALGVGGRRKKGRRGDPDDDMSPGQRAVRKYQRRAAREAAAWEDPELRDALRRRRVPRRLVDREKGFLGFFRRWSRRYSNTVFKARARLDPLLRRGEWMPAEGQGWGFYGGAPLIQDFVHGALRPLWRSCPVALPVPPAPYAACVAATRQALTCLCLGLLSERPTTQAALVLALAAAHLLWTLYANPLRVRPLAAVHLLALAAETAIAACVLQIGVAGPDKTPFGAMEQAYAMNCVLITSIAISTTAHLGALYAHASVLFATWYAGGDESAALAAAEMRAGGPLMGVTRSGLPAPADVTPRTGVTVLSTAATARTRLTGAAKGPRGARSLAQSLRWTALFLAGRAPRAEGPALPPVEEGDGGYEHPEVLAHAAEMQAVSVASTARGPLTSRRLPPAPPPPPQQQWAVRGPGVPPSIRAGPDLYPPPAAPEKAGRRVLGGSEWEAPAAVELEPLPGQFGPSFSVSLAFGAPSPDLPNTPSPDLPGYR